MLPTVAVIVPVYKVERYLEKCVNSLMEQTYEALDVILVDDGSPDCCPEMCDAFAAQYGNITALHKPNGGLGDARNYGVRHTERDWIVFVDSDDYVEPEYIATLVNLRNEFDAKMVITRTVRENEDGSGKPKHAPFDSFLANRDTALYEVYTGQNVGWAAYGKLFPRSVLLKHPFPDGYYEDCACMYAIIEECDKVAIGNYGENYHYIRHEGSILCSDFDPRHLRIFDIAGEFETFIRETHPDLSILILHFYKRAVIQLLNMQRMSWPVYKEIFLKYRSYFRENLVAFMKESDVTVKTKLSYLLLCGSPELFYLQRTLLSKNKNVISACPLIQSY